LSDAQANDWVKIGDAPNEPEAIVITGHLEAIGIEALYASDPGAGPGLGPLAGGTDFGPQEILVHAADVDRALEALAARDPS
jgi:hypothetical protein